MDMKVKVKKPFKDKYTGKLFKAGEEIELNLSRVNEIILVGGLIEVLEVVQEESEPAKDDANETEQVEEPVKTPTRRGRK